MVERKTDPDLSAILKAASDPTRRAILTQLAQDGPTRVTEIAARFSISLNAVSKHIKTLEGAGLVGRRMVWREHLIELRIERLAEIDRWFGQLRSIWSLRLETPETLLKEQDAMSQLELTVTRRIAAPAKRIFDAWLDPKMLARFMTPGEGMTVPHAATDPKVGGKFRIVMQRGDQEIPHEGVYKEIDPYGRLAFTWKSPFSNGDSTVTLTLGEVAGGTDVTLHHVRFASEESRDNHMKGWGAILAALETALQ